MYVSIVKGSIVPRKCVNYIGRTITTKKGRRGVVISQTAPGENSRTRVVVRFEDGIEKESDAYDIKTLAHPDDVPKPVCGIGDKFMSNRFGEVIVVEYINSKHIVVQFDNGEKRAVQYGAIVSGKVTPPSFSATNLLEWIYKAENKYGVGRYDYSMCSYANRHSVMIIKCNTCGSVFKRKATDFIGKDCVGCLDCYRKSILLSFEEFTLQAGKAHCGKYLYSKESWNGIDSRIDIICPYHGVFSAAADDHRNGRCGCPTCRSDDNKNSTYNKLILPEGYSKVCLCTDKYYAKHNKCGTIFSRKLVGKETAKFLCPSCGIQNVTFDVFLERAREANGNEYDYSEYESISKNVKITHKSCGKSWYAQAGSHINGNYGKPVGCPYCATHGFSYGRDGTLYVIASDTGLVKVGVTHRKVKDRIKQIQRTTKEHLFHEYKEWKLPGEVAGNVEMKSHELLRGVYEQPNVPFDGYTECFCGADVCYICEIVEKFIREHKK